MLVIVCHITPQADHILFCFHCAPLCSSGILYNVTGGPDLTLHEVMQVGEVINELADNSAQCIFGTVEDPK
jgi:cell division GTPase FtsZ